MTELDRFERRLPGLMDELARTDTADVLATVLATTAGVRQQSGWTSREWWRAAAGWRLEPLPSLPAARVALMLVLVALVAAATALVGSRLLERPTPRLPDDLVLDGPTPRLSEDAPVERPTPRLPDYVLTYRGDFTPVTELSEASRFQRSIAELRDGRLLLWPADPNGRIVLWDRRAATVVAGPAPIAWRSLPAMVGLADGRLLVVGGDIEGDRATGSGEIGASTAELYDPAAGAFSATGPMIHPRWIFGATRLNDGRVLIVGGVEAPVTDSGPITSAEIYDPGTNTFSATGPLVGPRMGPSMATLSDGRVLVLGGRADNGDDPDRPNPELYDPALGRFSAGPAAPEIPVDTRGYRFPLRAHAPMVALPDGRAIVPGLRCQEVHDLVDGRSAGSWPTPTLVFDAAAHRFTEATPMPHCVHQAYALPNGEVFVGGWYYVDGPAGDQASPGGDKMRTWSGLYDPVTDRVRVTAPPPGGPYVTFLALADGRVLAVTDGHVQVFE